MANESINVGIKDSWSLLAFARMKGKMSVGTCKAGTPEAFQSCSFTDAEGNRTMVGFSGNLGELTPEEIVKRKDSLQVVLLNSGNYKLCAQGENNSWVDVEL
jgi:hypothetical protein